MNISERIDCHNCYQNTVNLEKQTFIYRSWEGLKYDACIAPLCDDCMATLVKKEELGRKRMFLPSGRQPNDDNKNAYWCVLGIGDDIKENSKENSKDMNTNNLSERNNTGVVFLEKILEEIAYEDKLTFKFQKGFEEGSDTEDVFQGLYGKDQFENSFTCLNALDGGEISHTVFKKNGNYEKNVCERLVKDNFWTEIIFHDRENSEDKECHVVIENINNRK